MEELRLEYNALKSLDGALVGVQGLERLNLSHNLLARISPDDLISLDQLKVLDVSYNRLRTLEETSKVGAGRTNDHPSKLRAAGQLRVSCGSAAGQLQVSCESVADHLRLRVELGWVLGWVLAVLVIDNFPCCCCPDLHARPGGAVRVPQLAPSAGAGLPRAAGVVPRRPQQQQHQPHPPRADHQDPLQGTRRQQRAAHLPAR